MKTLLAKAPAFAVLLGSLAGLSHGSAAHAAGGFTGSFAPSQWQLKEILGPANTPPLPTATATTTVSDPNYNCASATETTCIYDLDAPAGAMTLVGSDVFDHGSASEAWSINWEMTYTGTAPYQLTFTWDYASGDPGSDDESYFYTIDSSNTLVFDPLSNNNGDSGVESVTLQSGMRLGFGVSTLQNTGTPGMLTITQFNPATSQVPAPLPLLGAGAAFSWSRRLRERQRRRAAEASLDVSRAA